MAHLTSHHTLPPFPEDIETAPLVTVDLAKLEARDAAEIDILFDAGKRLGFFYLACGGSELGRHMVGEAEKLNKLQGEWFALPQTVKNAFWAGKEGNDKFYSYRWNEKGTSKGGNRVRNETYNMRKDEILGYTESRNEAGLIRDNRELLQNYVIHCRIVVELLLDILEVKLLLPIGSLRSLHRREEPSGDHLRFTLSRPRLFDPEIAKTSEHTDYGSITILFNWLGGLQIRTPVDDKWVYVRPVPSSCIVNFGDALVKFTAGVLRSNIHRVVPPAGIQADLDRYSLVYFLRPENAVLLARLKGGVVDKQPITKSDSTCLSSHEWIMRRALGDMRGIYTHSKGLEP